MHQGTMLNTYPDSLGKNLSELIDFLSMPEMENAFQSIYLLPSVFNSDIDRGYSIISYDLRESVATEADFIKLKEMGYDMEFDFILNHLSVLSPQFRDILKRGEDSQYCDFFIDWNKFWEGYGEMDEDGVIIPDPDMYLDVSRRKEDYPLLMIRFPDGREIPYWNTFFQKVRYPKVDEFDLFELLDENYELACRLATHINKSLDAGLVPKKMDWTGYESYASKIIDLLESRRRYLGQMDVNIKNPMVWDWFREVMEKLSTLGSSLIRLDAVFSLLKEAGKLYTATSPESWELVDKIGKMAKEMEMDVIPEHHTSYKSGAHKLQWKMGYPCYDYFLPLLLIDATEFGESRWLYQWAREQIQANVRTINMLGCHDGIPLRDPRGALPDDRVDQLEDIMVSRGGRRKCVHSDDQLEAYQMDISYYSAMDCDDRRLLLARAVQMFMPGKPQIWYQDLLAGENDLEIFKKMPGADNREINRHNYNMEEIRKNLQRPVVKEQIRLMQIRNTHPAFSKSSRIKAEQPDDHAIILTWINGDDQISLHADFKNLTYHIKTHTCQ